MSKQIGLAKRLGEPDIAFYSGFLRPVFGKALNTFEHIRMRA
jgi:hypothetical protein